MNFYEEHDKLYNKLVEIKIIYFLIRFSILLSYYFLPLRQMSSFLLCEIGKTAVKMFGIGGIMKQTIKDSQEIERIQSHNSP